MTGHVALATPEELISLADRRPEDLAAAVGAVAAPVAETVLAEIAARLPLFEAPQAPVIVQFDLGAGDQRLGYLLNVGDGAARPGRVAEPWVLIRQDLAELVRLVFGPAGPPRNATREVLMKDAPDTPGQPLDSAWRTKRRAAITAVHQVLSACDGYRGDLAGLAVRFGSDKWGSHWYTPRYERHFGLLRDEPLRILEIGVGGYQYPDSGGASLRMWKHYFRRGTVYGLDVFDKSGVDEPRLRTVVGCQGDADFLDRLGRDRGPFDIVIDDGSHLSSDVITSFTALFPHLRSGGTYVIEDLGTSYWSGWGGDSENLDNPATSAGFLKTLIDGLNHQERVTATPYAPTATDLGITGISLYHNLAFVEKGVNTEQPPPAWIPRTEKPYSWQSGVPFFVARPRAGG